MRSENAVEFLAIKLVGPKREDQRTDIIMAKSILFFKISVQNYVLHFKIDVFFPDIAALPFPKTSHIPFKTNFRIGRA